MGSPVKVEKTEYKYISVFHNGNMQSFLLHEMPEIADDRISDIILYALDKGAVWFSEYQTV